MFRALIAVALVILAAPVAVDAQPVARIARLGLLLSVAETESSDRATMSYLIPRALRDLGYVEGQNLHVERRFAGGQRERLPGLARDLERARVDVIVAIGNEALRAVQQTTRTMPIVMLGGAAEAAGLVTSLAQPGGNVTGVLISETTLAAKRLALIKEAVPAAKRIAILASDEEYNEAQLREAEGVAPSLGVVLVPVTVRRGDYAGAFAQMVAERAQALFVLSSPLLNRDRAQILDLAAKHRIPTIYQWRHHVEAGGLMAYGTNLTWISQRLASYVDRILRGAKPGTLPVEQPTAYELVINLKTAKALGLTIPPAVLARADEVIQ
jgi:putative tryptophan/tyrosine transport system substrate-binding protein